MTTDTPKLEAALDVLLRQAIEADGKRDRDQFKAIRATPFVWHEPSTLPNRAEREIQALLYDPVGGACRQAVRRIGAHIFATLGSTGAMRDVADRVAEMDPAKETCRAGILDHAWDGLGSQDDRWWC